MSTLEKFTADVSAISDAISMRDKEIAYLNQKLFHYEKAIDSAIEELRANNPRIANNLDEALNGTGGF